MRSHSSTISTSMHCSMGLISFIPVLLTLLAFGPQPTRALTECDATYSTDPVLGDDGDYHSYKCLGYDGVDSFNISTCDNTYSVGSVYADIATFSNISDFYTAINDLIQYNYLPEDNWGNIAAVDQQNYFYLAYSDSTNECLVYKGDKDISNNIDRFSDDLCNNHSKFGYICDIQTMGGGDPVTTTDGGSIQPGDYDCSSYMYLNSPINGYTNIRCISLPNLVSLSGGDALCAAETYQVSYGYEVAMVEVDDIAAARAIVDDMLDNNYFPYHHSEDSAWEHYYRMTYYMKKTGTTTECFVYTADTTLLTSNGPGFDNDNAVSEETDCTIPRGVFCWQKPAAMPTYCGTWFSYGPGGDEGICLDHYGSYPMSTLAEAQQSCSTQQTTSMEYGSFYSESTATSARSFFTSIADQLPDGAVSQNSVMAEPFTFKIASTDGTYDCFYFVNANNYTDADGEPGYVYSDDCTKTANAICTNTGSALTTTPSGVESCEGWTAIGKDGLTYFCVDTEPVASLSDMLSACTENDPTASVAVGSTSSAAEEIFTELADSLPSMDTSDYGSFGPYYVEFKMSDGSGGCYYFINDIDPDAKDLVSPVTACDGPGRTICVSSGDTTTMKDETTPLLIWTTPSFDAVLADLNLGANETDLSSIVGAVDSALSGAGPVSASALFSYAYVMKEATSGQTSAADLGGAVDTCSKIFDKAGSASKAEITNIASNVVGVIGSAMENANAPSNNSGNSSQSAEDLVTNTIGLIDKIGGAVSDTLSANDAPVVLETDFVGIAIAVQDVANPGSTVMQTGSLSISLEDNEGTGSLPLQSSSFKDDPYASFKTDNFKSGAAPLSMKVVGNDSASVNFKAATKANFSIEKDSETIPTEGVTKTYTFTTIYSFIKVFLTIPGDPSVYTVRCAMDAPPNETDPFIEAHITDELNITINTYNSTIRYSNTTDEMTIFLKGYDLGLGVVYVHTSVDQVNGTRTKRSTGSQYAAGAAVYSPRVWNETAKAWVPSPAVEIDPDSSGEEVVFKSNFMGSMTSDLATPPNTIDFDTVFDDLGAKTRENPYVLIVVCLIAGIYFILLIPIRRMDVRDYKLWEFLPILHNKPEDKYIYQISIAAGKQSSKEFDTEVFCCIYGDKGKTCPKTLDDGKRKNFQPGLPTNLTVTCQEDIGNLTHIHLWTRARDSRDSLFIEWIQVTDPERKITYTFLCNDWLSPIQTLCYGHEIFIADMQQGKDFVSLIKNNTKSKIFDDHLWLSVVKRPSKSNFSRVQRWSMCLSTLYLTMVVNAMWFPTSEEARQDTGPSVNIGPISLSFKTFSIAIMGSMIVIPPNMLIMFFFRRSRPFIPPGRRRKVQQEKESVTAVPFKVEDSDTTDDKLQLAEEGKASPELTKFPEQGNAEPEQIKPTNSKATSEKANVEKGKTISKKAKKEETPSIGQLKILQTSSVDMNVLNKPPRYMVTKKDRKVQEKYVMTEDMEAELKGLDKKNNGSFTLPWWGVILGYILCGVCIANGVWWPYLYSIQWGKEIALEWLAALVLSVFQSILIMQPIKVILLAVIASFFLQESLSDPDDPSLINTVSDLHGQVKPAESMEPPVRPQNIEKADPVQMYTEAKLHNKLFGKLKGTLAHILYLCLLIAVVSHNTDTDFYYQNKAIKDTFELNDIGLSRIEEIYPWLRETVFPNIYPLYAYNGDVLGEDDQKYIANVDGYLLGPVRMKQNREIEVDCDELKKVEMGKKMKVYECKDEEETNDWNVRWNGTYVEGNALYPEHIYEETKGAKYRARLTKYKLGGYSANLFKWSWMDILDQFESNIWIDKMTRSVFIEFVVNNGNVNVFTQVKIVLETPVYGGVFASYKVNSFRPYPYVNAWDFVFLVIQCIWFLVLCYIIFKEVKAFLKEGLKVYIKDPWHWVEVLNAILALVSCVFFAMRTLEVIKAVELMYNNRGKYVDFDQVMKWDTYYSLFIAGVLFIAIMQLYQPMDFSRQLTAIKKSLSHTGSTIAWYTLIFVILLVLYSHVMTIAFGSEFGAFVEFFRSFYYLFGMLLGILKYTDLIESDATILRVLFAVYMVVGNFILLNLFLSVINDGLAYMQENPDEVGFDEELSSYLKGKLDAWWMSLTGSKGNDPAKDLAKVRRGGPWNRELELYYSLLEDQQVTPIEDKRAEEYQANVDERAERAVNLFSLASSNKFSEEEKKSMKKCTQHDRKEHTVRAAIKTIIWDMLLSNDKARDFINRQPKPKQEPLRPETPQEEYHCLNETAGRIGPEGGRLEVLPGTWIIIDKGTFTFPTYIRVQAYTTNLFASHVIQLESEQPLAKPFKCCLPFKDGKKRDYCNVFVQRDDGPWTLSYNSVTCFSESLRCMCHPKGSEKKYRIAAKATPRKTVAKAGHTLDTKLAAGAVINAVTDSEEVKEAITEHLAGEMAVKWKEIAAEKRRLKTEVNEEMNEETKKVEEEVENSKSNLDLL